MASTRFLWCFPAAAAVVDAILDAFDVAPAHAFDVTPQFQVAADLLVVEDAEAVHHGKGASGALNHPIGVEFQIGVVANGQDDGIDSFHSDPHVLLDTQVLQGCPADGRSGPSYSRDAGRCL